MNQTIFNLKEAKALNTEDVSAAALTSRIKELEKIRDANEKQLRIKKQNAKASAADAAVEDKKAAATATPPNPASQVAEEATDASDE